MFGSNNEFKLTPCEPEPCDFQCGSNDDITDDDLAIFLKEEREKAEAERRAREELEASKRNEKNQCPKKRGNEEKAKKKPCRKVVKNPFFSKGLFFSADLPIRPPVPPPQFFPLAGEESKPKICQNKRRKKCKKKKTDTCDDEEDEECIEEEDGSDLEGEPCECTDVVPQCRKGRPCKKPNQGKNFPCKKKVSETSIPPQPRRIPALMKDLPKTCPKDIPEVERQIRMSQDNEFSMRGCKKKCSRKERVQQLLNQ